LADPSTRPHRSWKRILLWTIGVLAAVFVLIQFIPYGRTSHSNPPATTPFQWTDAKAEAIAKQSCYDCHSNETDWWWATNIAPFSWLVQADVDGGREHLNFSEWQGNVGAPEMADAVDGGMPPFQYTLMHPGAKLTDAEKQTLLNGFEASVAGSTAPAPSTTDAIAIINDRCGSCHAADAALRYQASSAAEAQQLIDRMVQHGAVLTPAMEQALVSYFTR
jgi:mono/diheme cytochrome c family protein